MKPRNRKIFYNKAIVICHGKSELCIANFIKSNLHLRIETFAKENGKSSIQITSLVNVLKREPFKSIKSLSDAYEIEVVKENNKKILKNFKLFIIMDTDDCTDEQKKNFINKKMFEKHWLYNYIEPIYNITNLEDVLCESEIMYNRINDKQKGTYYAKVFPINKKPFSEDTLKQVTDVNKKIKNCKNTNMDSFIDYCINCIETNEKWFSSSTCIVFIR